MSNESSVIYVLLCTSTKPKRWFERSWSMRDIEQHGKPDLTEPPEFLNVAQRTWTRPQDPITYKAFIERGREDEAEEWLKNL